MNEIGDILRRAREKKGLSLSDAALGTYISARYLAALEREEYGTIPGTVYMRGMLRNYGNFLGLSGVGLVDRYNAAMGEERPVERAYVPSVGAKDYLDVEPTARPQRKKMHRRRRKNRPFTRVEQGLTALIIILFLLSLYWIFG